MTLRSFLDLQWTTVMVLSFFLFSYYVNPTSGQVEISQDCEQSSHDGGRKTNTRDSSAF